MNSFKLTAVGNIATDLELTGSNGSSRLQIPLIGNDYAGKDAQGNPKERVTQVFFTAFGSVAEAIARHCRKGDQLILDARMQSNNYNDKETGKLVYAYDYIVESFTFGAPGKIKREELANR